LYEKLKATAKKLEKMYENDRPLFTKCVIVAIAAVYLAGMFVNSVRYGISNTFGDTKRSLIELNPLLNLAALFTVEGFAIIGLAIVGYCLMTKKGYWLISGYKTIFDKKRNIEILPEGTHGTSSWISKKEMSAVFNIGDFQNVPEPVVGKLSEDKDNKSDYVGIKTLRGMNNNIMVYGAPGTGKSQGFVKPFVMQAAQRGESVICVDPKSEFYEAFAEYFKHKGYVVKVFNLLDRANSDGMNCFNDLQADKSLVQSVAEIIINNTSGEKEKQDFWEKSEKNLLMALIHYYLDLKDEHGNHLPIEKRSLGAIYNKLAICKISDLDDLFGKLPDGHPALPPYGIFKQANPQILGNILIGLGSRLNVFQDRLVDRITKYNDIDLELPGKEKCAYFCVVSDQDSSMEFMSSMFFSLLFVRLSDYARKFGVNRRLPVSVNVILDEFCNIGKLLDFKKVLSTARSRGINIQIIVQSLAQLADRYPKTEWQELVGNCDCQLFLGCNDQMTAEFISKQCGDMTIRVNNATIPMTPLFSPVLHSTRPFSHMKSSTSRALLLPDEVRRLPSEESVVIVRGQKTAKLFKIIPDEHPEFEKLVYSKIVNYEPWWKDEPDIGDTASAREYVKPFTPKSEGEKPPDYTQPTIPRETAGAEYAALKRNRGKADISGKIFEGGGGRSGTN
jgi:type IV secretion system protein VirD4